MICFYLVICLNLFLLLYLFLYYTCKCVHPLFICFYMYVLPTKLFSSFYQTTLFFVLPSSTAFGSYYLSFVEIRFASILACLGSILLFGVIIARYWQMCLPSYCFDHASLVLKSSCFRIHLCQTAFCCSCPWSCSQVRSLRLQLDCSSLCLVKNPDCRFGPILRYLQEIET